MMENIVIAAALIADLGLTAWVPRALSKRAERKQSEKEQMKRTADSAE